ncbi:hypothetical protein SEA_SUNSHINE924_40 [Mycobacterium Phage Sunshine924]|nr:hypothetical protein SEA_SUNSHINE924_40 [Mycobacterium Phage Sunshine924]
MSKKTQKKYSRADLEYDLHALNVAAHRRGELLERKLDEIIDLLQTLVEQTKPKRDILKEATSKITPEERRRHIEAMINPVAPVSKQLVEEYHNDPQMKVVREHIDSELLKSISDEKERYHAYRDKPLQPYVRVHEAP